MPIKLTRIKGALDFPRPDWGVIAAWLARRVPAAEHWQAWTEVLEDWYGRINKGQHGRFRGVRSEHIFALAPKDFSGIEPLLEFGEVALETIDRLVGNQEKRDRPLPLIVLPDAHLYYHYLAHHQPQGEFGGALGQCIKSGYVHVVLGPGSLDLRQLWLAHELAHVCTSGLNLPLWVEEGVTQLAEEALHTQGQFHLETGRVQELKAYWHTHGLKDFWFGKGFSLPDEGQSCSYDLARILGKFLTTDHREGFAEFLRTAQAADAGASAALECLGITLESLAAQFLGAGSWTPVPAEASAFCRRGELFLQRGEFDAAVADFDKTLELDPGYSQAYSGRGDVHLRAGRWSQAVAEYDKAIRLTPNQAAANNNLAWLLATCPDDAVRHGERALRHAQKACEATGYLHWKCLLTLAAAHAEAGEFAEARAWTRDAYREAPLADRPAVKPRWEALKEEKPWREDLTVTTQLLSDAT